MQMTLFPLKNEFLSFIRNLDDIDDFLEKKGGF